MTGAAPARRRSSAALALALVLTLPAAGCATVSLRNVVVGDRAATGSELQAVQVLRQGSRLPTQPGMAIEKLDEIKTDAQSSAILSLGDGTEIIMAPNTHVRLSSLRVLLGRIFVSARGFFEVETEYVTAGVGGTEFLVTVTAGDVSVGVLDGVVTLRSRTGAWPPVPLRRLEAARARRSAPPDPRPIDQAEANAIVRWVNAVRRAGGSRARALMPEVRGLPEARARAALTDEHLTVGRVEAQLTRKAPPGTVIAQEPPAGSPVTSERAVRLVVEGDAARVPAVVGRRVEDARRAIRDRRLTVGRESSRITGRAQPGTVIEQDPTADTEVAAGSAITLIVEGASMLVPRVEGQPLDAARRRIVDAGLTVGQIRERYTGRQRPGTVLRQTPGGDARVEPRSAVELEIEQARVTVPKLQGLSLDQAQNQLSAQGLRTGTITRTSTTRARSGTVIQQSPDAGTPVAPGSTVDLEVAASGRDTPILRDTPLPRDAPIRRPLPETSPIR